MEQQFTPNKTEMNHIFRALATERAYQDDLWSNSSMTPAECLIYMRHHLNKAFTALSTSECVGVCDTVMDQIRKITGLGLACGEEHGMPLRPGFESSYLFVAGDLIFIYDVYLYQCICSDAQQAVFAKADILGVPEDISIVTMYEDMFVVFNFDNPDFKFERVTIDDIKRGFLQTS